MFNFEKGDRVKVQSKPDSPLSPAVADFLASNKNRGEIVERAFIDSEERYLVKVSHLDLQFKASNIEMLPQEA